MSFWNKLFGRKQETKLVESSPELIEAIRGWSSGFRGSHDAMYVSTFNRACVLIADGAALPRHIRKRTKGGKREYATDHPLYDLLSYKASTMQDSYQFLRTMILHAAATGDSVAHKIMVRGQVRELIASRPRVQIDVMPGTMEKVFTFIRPDQRTIRTGRKEVFHLSDVMYNGVHGMDMSDMGRNALRLSRDAEGSHISLHENGIRPSGMIVAPAGSAIAPEEVERLRTMWMESYGGVANTGKPIVATGGLDWKPLRMSGADAEHLATRNHQVEEVCRIRGVLPAMLGHGGDGAPTYASMDAFRDLHFRVTLMPWLRSVDSAMQAQLLTRDEVRDGYEIYCDTSEWTRGSLDQRIKYYTAALGTGSTPGWMSPDEVRDDDGLDPINLATTSQIGLPLTMEGAADRITRLEQEATAATAAVSVPSIPRVSQEAQGATS